MRCLQDFGYQGDIISKDLEWDGGQEEDDPTRNTKVLTLL